MALTISVTCHSSDGSVETIKQEYTDSPFMETAITRAKEIAADHYSWGVPEGTLWTKIEFSIEIQRIPK